MHQYFFNGWSFGMTVAKTNATSSFFAHEKAKGFHGRSEEAFLVSDFRQRTAHRHGNPLSCFPDSFSLLALKKRLQTRINQYISHLPLNVPKWWNW
ncbi:hypothetical protein GKC30_13180 [Pseudodesulfovibrio sp. F-1]|uniref:Uncharacterized protein n=1 Tax=Pseudodesulfovibrio alkaliphilus TaxID=2661613 RepID=A0A7K1KR76_9BACT|nr:hypothetical protein [Pseudodesulfovibrio alkaliphilus]MUM78588.1 hypothetical protein [Pseudodesulfovibrio alkaliphilus]